MENENQDQTEYRDTKDQSSKRDSHNKIESNVSLKTKLETNKQLNNNLNNIILNLSQLEGKEIDKKYNGDNDNSINE